MTVYEVSGLSGNLGHLLRAAGALFGLGVVIAFSPTTLGIEIEVLEQPRASRRAVLIIAGSVGAAATLLAGVFLVVSPDTLRCGPARSAPSCGNAGSTRRSAHCW